jgi:hypothetical protein
VRIPEPLRQQIREKAATERRSFSSQCVVLLESALAPNGGLPEREAAIVADFENELDAVEVDA